MKCGSTVIKSETGNDTSEAQYATQVGDNEGETQGVSSSCSVVLPRIPSYHRARVDVLVFTEFDNTDDKQLMVDHDVSGTRSCCLSYSESRLLTNHLRRFADLGYDAGNRTDGNAINAKVTRVVSQEVDLLITSMILALIARLLLLIN